MWEWRTVFGAASKEVPMRILALLTLLLGLVSQDQASAQTYDPAFPICMFVVSRGGGGYYDCRYYTMAQCAASASGRAAQCAPNPYYSNQLLVPRRNATLHRQAEERFPPGPLLDIYCLQGRPWGYPGNCQFSSYAQCMATASGTDAYCGINPRHAFVGPRRGTSGN